MNDYLTKGHAERVPKEELQPKDRPVWCLPHHPVIHPLKPGKGTSCVWIVLPRIKGLP